MTTGERRLTFAAPFPRHSLSALVEWLIERIDDFDGDPDLENTLEDWEDGYDHECAAE